ncbi:MAG: hypothetical protein QOK42_1232 [Frankiaceae bacterium]|jgi:hypothetical protein|nr:hypothetical protein [Frankiaceae bacterium]MDX6224216.1 hypothetical protein [Frankiales bacterium]MDX6275078.1 hypothetical protein [Frankiales bacterium]
MTRSTRRIVAAALVAGAVATVPAANAYADATAVLTATTIGGTLTLAGAGAAVSGNATPGGWSALTGATVLTVADLRGSSAGWHVTAQFSAPAAGLSLGGANVRVTSSNPAGDALSNIKTYSQVTLGSPATVLSSYGSGSTPLSGAGISTASAGYDVQLPTTAQLGDVYGGSVVFTVSTG